MTFYNVIHIVWGHMTSTLDPLLSYYISSNTLVNKYTTHTADNILLYYMTLCAECALLTNYK